MAQLTLLGAAPLISAVLSADAVITFDGHFAEDALGDTLKLAIYLISAVVFLYSRDYLRQRELFKGEYYVLGLFGGWAR
ncbi:MAG: hypothetical protein R3F37_04550 [Candidatus Competibacteraceae bacterium]